MGPDSRSTCNPMNQVPSPDQDRSKSPEEYEMIRKILLGKPAFELGHELPGLIDTVERQSLGGEETIRYLIGVSFTTQGTAFDYWIDRVIDPDQIDGYRVETIKDPINYDHKYVTFFYPPDPEFDAETLRGALLATVEDRLEDLDIEDHDGNSTGIVERLIRKVRRVGPIG